MRKVIPGKKGECPSCGGELVLPNRPLLICDSCGHTFRAKGALSLAKEVNCTKCNAPLRAAEPGESATTRKIERNQQEHSAASVPEKTVQAAQVSQPGKPEVEASAENGGPSPTGFDAPTIQFPQEKPAPKGKSDKSRPLVASQIQAGFVGEEEDGDSGDDTLQLVDEEDSLSQMSEKDKQFGEYRIESEIARGGMGIVYKAYDQKLRRTVALKVLLKGEESSNQSTMRFLREARALGALNHPNIVSVYSVGEEHGKFYYTMEFVDGYDLAALVAKEKTPLRDVLCYIREICLALDAAHRRGIIHRDLKPQNILIQKTGRPQIMDFGLAKDMTSTSFKSLSGSVLGTPSYMSPEQAKGESRSIDHRTDIYSIGVILYELATGSRPFGGDTVLKTIEEIVNKEPMPPIAVRPNLDKDLNTIILKCLEKNPDKRYQRMPLLAEDLRLYLAGEPINARVLSPIRRAMRFVRSNRSARRSLTIIPTVLITAIVVYLIWGGESDLKIFARDANSDNPQQVVAALISLESLFENKDLRGEDEINEGLEIARAKILSTNEEASEVAMRIVGKNQDIDSVTSLLQALRQKSLSLSQRKSAISALVSIGPETLVFDRGRVFDSLTALIENQEQPYQLRIAALRALQTFPHNQNNEIFLSVAKDTDNPVELRLAAIGILGEKISFTSPYMNDFLRLQGDEESAIVTAVESALARSRTKTTVLSLYGIQGRTVSAMEGIADIHQANAKRNQQIEDIINGTGNNSTQPREEVNPVTAMVRNLSSNDETLRMAAAYDLGELGDPEAIKPLVMRLTDPIAGVRRCAAVALLKLAPKAKNNPLDPNMVIQLLQNPDALIRENAAFLLGGLECKEALPALLRTLENESSQRATRTMVKALSLIGGEGALEAIQGACEKTSGKTAQACLEAMIPFGMAAVPHLIAALAEPGEQTRAVAVNALKEISGEDFGDDAERWKQWLQEHNSLQ
ncbi:MAG: protein kinase [Planctomycetes bacterium]|nr:protein kinase [Planctomycetota bacterium]